MSAKGKLKKFAAITSFPNVLEAFTFDDGYLHADVNEKVKMQGKWGSQFFGNDHPLCLELCCGKGEYTLGLAELYPERNHIGMDIKGNRIWKGARKAIKNNMNNVGFLRSRIEFIDVYFDKDEVSEIWIIFPDPFLKSRDANRRLTSKPFLDRYLKVMKDGGYLHLKTDSDVLYEYTLNSIDQHENYQIEFHDPDIDHTPRSEEMAIKTYYEKQHLQNQKKIKYIRARLFK